DRGPDRVAHRADQDAHRASPHARQRPSLSPRPADARWSSSPLSQLPAEQRPRALSRAGARARPSQVIAAGSPAPEFVLKRADGSDFKRTDLEGKTTI